MKKFGNKMTSSKTSLNFEFSKISNFKITYSTPSIICESVKSTLNDLKPTIFTRKKSCRIVVDGFVRRSFFKL